MTKLSAEHHAKMMAGRGKPRSKTCQECGSPYTATHPNARYCPIHADGMNGWRRRNPERFRVQSRLDVRRARIRRYGLEPSDYEARLAAQGGVCAICQRPERLLLNGKYLASLAIDHDAATGRVRGLLCSDCNTSLGKFGHDPARLRRAIEYLSPGL